MDTYPLWVELLVGSIGLSRLAFSKVVHIRKLDKDLAVRRPWQIDREWRAFFAMSSDGVRVRGPVVHAPIERALSQRGDGSTIVTGLGADEAAIVAMCIDDHLLRAKDLVTLPYPTNPVGLVEPIASTSTEASTGVELAILDDPMVGLMEMSQCIWTRAQSAKLSTIWPATYEFMTRLMYQALTARKAAAPKWGIPWKLEKAVASWLMVPWLRDKSGTDIMAALQEASAAAPAKPDLKPLGVDKELEMTPTQRVRAL